MNEYMKANQKFWNEAVDLHVRSKFYDLELFKKTRNSLLPVEQTDRVPQIQIVLTISQTKGEHPK